MRAVIAPILVLAVAIAVPAFAEDKDPLKTAVALAKDGRYVQAQAQFQQLIDRAGNDPVKLAPILLARADAYFAAGEYGRAETAVAAAQGLRLSDALQARAAALADKVRDKLRSQRIEGFATLSTARDSRVRHRITVISTGSGVQLVEICDEEFVDFDDESGPVIDTAESCYLEEVTGDPKASSKTRDIADWNAQTTDKVEHQIALDRNGSFWRTVGELAQTWQVEAGDQDSRVVRVRTGPSWFLPNWQTRFDLNAAYLTRRQDHQTTLQYFAPHAAVEWRPRPDLKLNAKYQYEVRQASSAQLNGSANLLASQARWDATQVDRLTGQMLWRQQATQFAYNSYVSGELRAKYRRGFKWFGLDGGFVEAEARLRVAQFQGSAPSDGGAIRRDITPAGILHLGHDFGKDWTVKLSCSYKAFDSTIPRYVRDDWQYYLSVTRNF